MHREPLLYMYIYIMLMLHSVKRRRNWHRHDYSEINDGKKVHTSIAEIHVYIIIIFIADAFVSYY